MSALSLLVRQQRLLVVRDSLNAGTMSLYTALGPATPESPTGETLLGVITLAAISGAIGASGDIAQLTISVPRVSNIIASGTVGWVRLASSNSDGVLDLVAGEGGSGAPVIFSNTDVYTGGEATLLSCVISE